MTTAITLMGPRVPRGKEVETVEMQDCQVWNAWVWLTKATQTNTYLGILHNNMICGFDFDCPREKKLASVPPRQLGKPDCNSADLSISHPVFPNFALSRC